jgi:hypothetical protein
MMRIAFAVVVFLLLRAGPAAADLYRWIDPETGSAKFSSYPPPWYGDAAAQRHAPKVEVIPTRDGAARPGPADTAQEGSKALESLEAQRKALLLQLPALGARPGRERPGSALQKQLETYVALAAQMDKLDPQGAAARRGELQMAIEKITKENRDN